MDDPKRAAGGLLAVLVTGQALANIDTAIVNVATPAIHADLRATGAQLQLIVSGYILAYAMLLITGARLGDMRGYRRVFVGGLGIFTLASLACGLALDPTALILARIVEGGGAALVVSQVLSGIQLNFSGDARKRALGALVVAMSGSAVLGQILGGALVSANLFGAGWRPIFLINVPIGAVLMLAAARFLPEQHEGRGARLDLAGVATLSAAVLLALLPLILGREEHWPVWTWACLLASLPAAWLFITVERGVAMKGGYPLVNLHILRRPAVSWALASRAAAAGTYFALLFVLALYLQQGLGKSPLYSGLALVSWVAAFGIGGPLLRRLPGPLARHAAWTGTLLMTCAYLGLAASLAAGQEAGGWLLALLGLGGLGFGIATTALLTHIMGAVPVEFAPDISGLYNTNSQTAALVAIAVFGTAYLGLDSAGGRAAAMHAFGIVDLAFAGTVLFATGAAYLAIRQPRETSLERVVLSPALIAPRI